jgi:hypothetical protein
MQGVLWVFSPSRKMEPVRIPTPPNSVFKTKTNFWILALACTVRAADDDVNPAWFHCAPLKRVSD